MSVQGLFTKGFFRKEVKAIQNKAKEALLEGKTIMSWNDGGGTSVTKQFAMPVADVLAECAYALRKLDAKAGSNAAPAGKLSTLPNRLPL